MRRPLARATHGEANSIGVAEFLVVGILPAIARYLAVPLDAAGSLVSLYALVAFSFFTFSLPVATGWMSTELFLIGAGLSAIVTVGIVRLVYRGRPDRSRAASLRCPA